MGNNGDENWGNVVVGFDDSNRSTFNDVRKGEEEDECQRLGGGEGRLKKTGKNEGDKRGVFQRGRVPSL